MITLLTEQVDGNGQAIFPQGKSVCLQKLEKEVWHSTVAIRINGWHVGIRVNSEEALDEVEGALSLIRAPEMDGLVEPNFSVEINRLTARRLHLVYRDHEIVARCRKVEDLVRDLIVLLDDIGRLWTERYLALNCAVVYNGNRQAVLVPARYQSDLLTRRSYLERQGLTLGTSRLQLLDPTDGTLVLDLQDRDLQSLLESEAKPIGRLTPAVWILRAGDEQRAELRAAETVRYNLSSVSNRRMVGIGASLQGLANSTRSVRGIAIPSGTFHSAALAAEVASHLT